jgi:pre-mRNA cleavage complex 2 protein Pcf11
MLVFTRGVVKNERPDQEATLRAQTVVSPSDVNKKLPCPICQEKFEEFWCDEQEQWMLRNAVMVNDKIYHATCYTDTATVEVSSII